MFGPEYFEPVGVVLWGPGVVLCVECAEQEFPELVDADWDTWLNWGSRLGDQRSVVVEADYAGYYPEGLYCEACGAAIFEAEEDED